MWEISSTQWQPAVTCSHAEDGGSVTHAVWMASSSSSTTSSAVCYAVTTPGSATVTLKCLDCKGQASVVQVSRGHWWAAGCAHVHVPRVVCMIATGLVQQVHCLVCLSYCTAVATLWWCGVFSLRVCRTLVRTWSASCTTRSVGSWWQSPAVVQPSSWHEAAATAPPSPPQPRRLAPAALAVTAGVC